MPTWTTRLRWEATCEGKRSDEANGLCCNVILAMLLFYCLIRFVGQETNKQQKHMPRMMAVGNIVMMISVSMLGCQLEPAWFYVMQHADMKRHICKSAHLFSLPFINWSGIKLRDCYWCLHIIVHAGQICVQHLLRTPGSSWDGPSQPCAAGCWANGGQQLCSRASCRLLLKGKESSQSACHRPLSLSLSGYLFLLASAIFLNMTCVTNLYYVYFLHLFIYFFCKLI